MVRQNIGFNPAQKLFEASLDFSGGLNTEISNERLAENEFPVFENVDLRGRGSAKRRYGRVEPVTSYPYNTSSANAQGVFTYYRTGETAPDLIYAISGRLYLQRKGVGAISFLPISDSGNSDFQFQATLPIEAVQYRENLFVATGTKLCEVNYNTSTDTFSAKVVVPYKPTGQEVIYIGTNALAADPSSWIANTEGSTVTVTSIVPSSAQTLPSKNTRFSAYVEKPAALELDYKWSYRKTGVGSFNTVKNNSPDNFADISFGDVGKYDIKVDVVGRAYTLNDTTSLWSGTQSAVTQRVSTGTQDGAAYPKACLVLTGVPADVSKDMVWYDFPTPFDMTRGNSVEWWWTNYAQTTQNGYNPGDVQLKFYTQGDLNTPVLVLSNPGGERGRGSGGGWNKVTSSYDPTTSGINRITRMAVRSTTPPGNTYNPNSGQSGWTPASDTSFKLDFIVNRNTNSSSSFTLTEYEVVGAIDPSKDASSYAAIQTCRIIRLHWDRLMLARDNKFPSQVYISDLNNPRYVPTGGRIDFSLDRGEAVTGMTRYRDMLVVFTKSTISMLTGTSPDDYRKVLVHDEIGCVAGRSIRVVGNDALFLSEDGLYRLRPNSLSLDMLNVQRIDSKIQTDISKLVSDVNACAVFADGQYWINFPSTREIYRLYTQTGSWVKDTSLQNGSAPLRFSQMLSVGEKVYNLSYNGRVYTHNEGVYTDVGDAFIMKVESKMLDQSASFNFKKLKKLHVLAQLYRERETNFFVTVLADAQVSLTPEIGTAVEENGFIVWKVSSDPNVVMSSGSRMSLSWTLNESLIGDVQIQDHKTAIRGKCKRTRIRFEHKDPYLCELYGFGFEFKLKKV